MIVRNEEQVIARCLDSVQGIADEYIIVDTGSTDKTKEIISAYTQRNYEFQWIHDFAAARNYSFEQATCDYILWLDADDVLLEKDREKLLELKASLNPAYDSVMMDYVLSRDGQGNAQMLTRRNRLVKRSSGFRWVNPVHEVLVVSGNVIHVPIEISHMSNRELKNPLRNLEILEKEIAREQGVMSHRTHFYYANELMDVGRTEEAIARYEEFLRRDADYFEDHLSACGHLAHCYRQIGNRSAGAERSLCLLPL